LILILAITSLSGQIDSNQSNIDTVLVQDSLEVKIDKQKPITIESGKLDESLRIQETKVKKINWWQVAAGSLITITIYLLRLLKSIHANWKTNSMLFGNWHAYHYTRVNFNPVLKKSEWVIKQRWLNPGIKIKIIDKENVSLELNYNGSINVDDNFISINAKGINHSESFQTKLLKPIPNADTIMLGFNIGKDFNHELFTTAKLVCRNKRTNEEANEVLKNSNKWLKDELCIRLTKEPITKPKNNSN